MSMNLESAVRAAQSADIDDVIDARQFAENLGFAAFRTGKQVPAAFAPELVLREGFEEGFSNARCEHALVRAGLA